MNRLQKRAWLELAVVTICMAILMPGISIMVKFDAKGVENIMIFLVVGGATGLVGCIHEIKVFNKYDEREKKIYQFAFMLSCVVFVLFLFCCAFITLFTVGGKGHVPSYSLLVSLLGGVFIAQLVQSAVILIKCAAEENDG